MSVKMLKSDALGSSIDLSTKSPTPMPPTCDLIGTPASISESDDPQVAAMEVDPLDESISETTLIAYGNSSELGKTGESAFSAKLPWPMSRLPGPPIRPVSPVENGGKL